MITSQELTRQLTKLRKKHSNALIVSVNKNKVINQLGVGYILTSKLPSFTEDDIQTEKELDTDVSLYTPVIVLGASDE